MFANFIVGAADYAVVDGQTRATELGKHFVGQFGERRGDVANLLFALFGILVEGEYANDGFFVLNVALLYQFFEPSQSSAVYFVSTLAPNLFLLNCLCTYCSAVLRRFSANCVLKPSDPSGEA